jgi:virulence factor
VGKEYRLTNLHKTVESLIASGVIGAFVHAATAAHFEIVQSLLLNNIHVYVDKPITDNYASTEKLMTLAKEKGLLLMAGFNRRYAPAYQKLRALREPNMIIMQKNRSAQPGVVRTFIFDDFIHVVDTLLYLLPTPMKKLAVQGRKKNNLLYHVVVQMEASDGTVAIGIMNRDSGTTEEKLEIFTSAEKATVYNVTDLVIQQEKNETKIGVNDWASTLHKRGFDQVIDHFLNALESKSQNYFNDDLLTHKLCEEIVMKLEADVER